MIYYDVYRVEGPSSLSSLHLHGREPHTTTAKSHTHTHAHNQLGAHLGELAEQHLEMTCRMRTGSLNH